VLTSEKAAEHSETAATRSLNPKETENERTPQIVQLLEHSISSHFQAVYQFVPAEQKNRKKIQTTLVFVEFRTPDKWGQHD